MAKNHALHVAEAPAQSPTEPTQTQAATPPASNTIDKTPKVKPSKVLPNIRISFSKQLDLLRAYAAASGADQIGVTVDEVGVLAKMVGSTVTLANPFFQDIGLIKKQESKGGTGGTRFVPAPEVFELQRAYEWDKKTAAHKLAPLMQRTWFVQSLIPRLTMSAISEDDAISVLADKATAAPAYKSNLKLLLDFIESAGIIARENGQIRLLKTEPPTPPAPATKVGNAETEEEEQIPPQQRQSGRLATGFMQPQPGALNFHIDVSVELSEMGTWTPDRIASFFQGVAMVLAAKGKLEQDASKG